MSGLNFKAIKALLKKEFIEHKVAFFYVPIIIISVVAITLIFGILINGSEWQIKSEFMPKNNEGVFDLFNGIYALSIFAWLAFMLVMLFFYFAASFSADRKNNALLFWKSLPISDLQIMGVKTLAGLTIFPAIIFIWSLVAALVGFAIFLLLSAFFPIVGVLNSQTSFFAFMNLQFSALLFISITLLWYLPLFSAVGLLGTIVRGWAVPAFILLLLMGKIIESLFTLSDGGYFTDLIIERFNAPFEALPNAINNQDLATHFINPNVNEISLFNGFAPAYISEINWFGMLGGLIVGAIFIYIASEYRRRKIQA